MGILEKSYSKRINTKFSGIFYRETITNDRIDKTFYIRYKDENMQGNSKCHLKFM